MLTYDDYHLPTTLREALALWSAAPAGSRLVAGATDILPWAREGRAGDVHIPTMIDVSRIDELAGYSIENGKVCLGANVVFQHAIGTGIPVTKVRFELRTDIRCGATGSARNFQGVDDL